MWINNQSFIKLLNSFIINWLQFLGEEYNQNSKQNPCTVVCRYDPLHESIADETHAVEEHKQVFYETQVHSFSYADYVNLPFADFKLPENTKCGQQHVRKLYQNKKR